MDWPPDGEKISKISLLVLAQLTNVTDGRTDRQTTDRKTPHAGNSRAALMHSIARQKSPFSRTAAHIFVSPGDAPAIITQYFAWIERQSMLAKPVAACTYLSAIVSELHDA